MVWWRTCYGWDLGGTPEEVLKKTGNQLQLKWLIDAYQFFPEKENFFIVPKSGKMEQSFFNKLAGNNDLWQQIKAGKSAEEIRSAGNLHSVILKEYGKNTCFMKMLNNGKYSQGFNFPV